MMYGNLPLPKKNWPIVPGSDPKPRLDTDVFLPYPIGEDLFQYDWQEKQEWNEPEGTSGGGLWQTAPYDNKLWSPGVVGMFAIRPELRPILSATFPDHLGRRRK